MNCKRARSLIALWVGDDVDPSDEQTLKQHVVHCEECQTHFARMKASMTVLQQFDGGPGRGLDNSVWPDVSHRIESQSKAASRHAPARGRIWVPTLAVAAALVVMVSFSIAPVVPPGDLSSEVITRASYGEIDGRLNDAVYPDASWRSLDNADDVSGPLPASGLLQHVDGRHWPTRY